MVKNFGGKKTKGMARKNLTVKPNNVLRVSTNEYEKYAQTLKLLGNGMCHVLCDDNVTRLCHIRGKFRGRGKRDNLVSSGSLLLIGIREYESGGDGKKLQNCDLLEVYNDQDKEKLKQTVTDVNWHLLSTNLMTSEKTDKKEDIQFIDNGQDEYYEMMNQNIKSNETVQNIAFEEEEEEEIDIDDI
jgi:translation initiation factor 1A